MGRALRLCVLSAAALAVIAAPLASGAERSDARTRRSSSAIDTPPATGVPRDLLSQLGEAKRPGPRDRPPSRACDACLVPAKYRSFAGFLRWAADYSNALWRRAARRANRKWRPAYIVHISTSTVSSRGCRELVTGLSPPFYCPHDRGGTIYIPEFATRDNVFKDKPNPHLRDWRERDFAFAYVVAHEWGHHAQAVLGYLSPRRLSIRIELQADCFAGLWAHQTWVGNLLEPGDIREAVNVTHFVGEPSGARPTSADAHGTSAQRKEWFLRGYRSGSFERCDTSTVATRG